MGLSTEKKKFKIDFQDGNCGSNLVFLIQKFLAIFDLQVTSMILTKFQVNWPFCSEVKNRFSRWLPWPPSWISNQNNFTLLLLYFFFNLQVTPMLPTKFRVNWPFGSGEEAKNRFSRWWPWQPSWVSNWNDFSYFRSTSHPDDSYKVSKSNGISVQEKTLKIDFHAPILDFQLERF